MWKLQTCAELPICRQTAPECTKLRIKFQKKFQGWYPWTLGLGLCLQTPRKGKGGKGEWGRGGREGKGGEKGKGGGGKGREGEKGGEGKIHLLLPKAHTQLLPPMFTPEPLVGVSNNVNNNTVIFLLTMLEEEQCKWSIADKCTILSRVNTGNRPTCCSVTLCGMYQYSRCPFSHHDTLVYCCMTVSWFMTLYCVPETEEGHGSQGQQKFRLGRVGSRVRVVNFC